MSNFATKGDLKKVRGVHTIDFAKKTDFDNLHIDKLKNAPSGLNSLKSKVDKLDINKLQTTPFDLSNLGDAVKKWSP